MERRESGMLSKQTLTQHPRLHWWHVKVGQILLSQQKNMRVKLKKSGYISFLRGLIAIFFFLISIWAWESANISNLLGRSQIQQCRQYFFKNTDCRHFASVSFLITLWNHFFLHAFVTWWISRKQGYRMGIELKKTKHWSFFKIEIKIFNKSSCQQVGGSMHDLWVSTKNKLSYDKLMRKWNDVTKEDVSKQDNLTSLGKIYASVNIWKVVNLI